MAEQFPNQVFIFKRVKNINTDANTADKFEQIK